MASANVIVLDESNFDAEVAASDVPVLVDVWGEYCGHCKAFEPVLDQLADEQKGSLKVGKVKVDDNVNLGARFNLRALPTFLFFKGGQHVGSVVGLLSKDGLLKKMQSL